MTTISANIESSAAGPIDLGAFDRCVILLVGLLMAIGTAMVYSASATVIGEPIDLARWWAGPIRQGVFALGGFLAMLFAARLDHRVWQWERRGDGWWSGLLYGLAVLLLLLVFVPGIGANRLGASRAIVVLSSPIALSFQPSEFAKIAMVVWMAALVTRPGFDLRALRRGYLPAIGSCGLLIGLVGIEDFGTAALLGAVLMCMLLVANARLLHLLGTAAVGSAAAVGLIAMKPYRLERIITYLSGQADSDGAGYQVLQSLLAIGSGGWWGRGLGAGVRKYGYLPQDNNDFIFAITCEELGVIGGLAIIAIFLGLLIRGWWIAGRASGMFGRLLAVGVVNLICLQAAFNVAVVTAAVPTKGISLPFVSAGGSGVLFLGVAAGLLASVGGRCGFAQSPRRSVD
jgi:cell division protein FtsW